MWGCAGAFGLHCPDYAVFDARSHEVDRCEVLSGMFVMVMVMMMMMMIMGQGKSSECDGVLLLHVPTPLCLPSN
jgi:hypothetical protein